MSCPNQSFRYSNSSLCFCNPGLFLSDDNKCVLVDPTIAGDWTISSGVSSAPPAFITNVIPLDSIKRITQSQAVLLEATLLFLALWLGFCVAVRFGRIDGGRSIWFRIRWWISRLDFAYATHHWLDDQKVVRKRKTELGGTFSVACWILFVGLFSALLYQVLTKRNVEVHKVRPVSAPDLQDFVNDIEFNVTTISSMTCAHLRGLDTVVIGIPGFIDYRVLPLSSYASYKCHNTSIGPTISLKCINCRIPRRNHYISWHFVDLPKDPAMAVGFQFKLTTKDHGNDKYASFVSGTLQSESYGNDKPKTYRGKDLNILQVHLFPQVYNYLNELKLIQPMFYDFIPGSSFSEISNLQASLETSSDGLVNTTLDISYLSDYIVEIDKANVLGPVSFLAEVGGLYAVSIAICLYFLLQCEARFKRFRNEDSIMRDIRSRKRAKRNWDKVRKYVNYTWGSSNMDIKYGSLRRSGTLMIDTCCGVQPMHKMKQLSMNNCSDIDLTFVAPSETSTASEITVAGEAKSSAEVST